MALKPDAKRKNKTPQVRAEMGEFLEFNVKQVQSLAGLGLTTEEIANAFSMSKATFERRCHAQPELYDALKKGRALARAKVAKTAFDMATSGKFPVMTIFWLKAQAKWQTKMFDDLLGDDDSSSQSAAENRSLLQIASMSSEDIRERIKFLEAIPVDEYVPLPEPKNASDTEG